MGLRYVTGFDVANNKKYLLPIDDLPQVLAYDGSNLLTTTTVEYLGMFFTQTLTYTGTLVTGVSRWERSA